jgi:hypothetical protein
VGAHGDERLQRRVLRGRRREHQRGARDDRERVYGEVGKVKRERSGEEQRQRRQRQNAERRRFDALVARDHRSEPLADVPLPGDQQRAVHVERGDVRAQESREVRGERQGE